MIWDFTEFRTDKKYIWKYDVFNENFTRADVKACLYLIDFKFPAKLSDCHLSLISDVTPSIPIYLFSFCIEINHYHTFSSGKVFSNQFYKEYKMALLATPFFVTFFMWWILVELKYKFKQVVLPIYKWHETF
jgi:hypothetical protein